MVALHLCVEFPAPKSGAKDTRTPNASRPTGVLEPRAAFGVWTCPAHSQRIPAAARPVLETDFTFAAANRHRHLHNHGHTALTVGVADGKPKEKVSVNGIATFTHVQLPTNSNAKQFSLRPPPSSDFGATSCVEEIRPVVGRPSRACALRAVSGLRTPGAQRTDAPYHFPAVARNELPWVIVQNIFNPNAGCIAVSSCWDSNPRWVDPIRIRPPSVATPLSWQRWAE